MKVVETDNFGRDYPDERFLSAVNSDGRVSVLALNEEEAGRIAEALNGRGGNMSPRYWKVVSDDYELQPGFEP